MTENKKKTFREILLGWGTKILLALLILSFGVWGIGDYVSPQQSNDVVATVGDSVITSAEFQSEVQFQVSQLQSVLGNNFTIQKAKAMGITSNVLNSLVERKVLSEGAREMGLIISDDLVSRKIRSDDRFKSQSGNFDRFRFNETMQRAGLSETGYIALYKGQLIQNQLLSGILNGQVVPKILVESLYKFRNEKRSMNFIKINHNSFRNIPVAQEEDLKKFHKDNSSQFTAPEYRSITLIQIQIKDIIGEIDVSDQEIKESYDDRIDEFKTAELRTIQQILVSNENKSKEIYNKIIAGHKFIDAAKKLAKLDPESLELGSLTRDQIPLKEISNTVFSLKKNIISKPIKSPLGWHILRVTNIKKAKQKVLSEVSRQIKKSIAEEKAVEALYNLSNKFEDELGGGSTIEEAAKRLNFKIRNIQALSADGNDLSDKKVPNIDPEVIQVAFNTEDGQDSTLTDLGDKGYFILRVNGITPPSLRVFEKIRDKIKIAWQLNQQSIAAEKKVKSLIDRMKGGTSLAEIANELKIKVQKSSEFLRTGAGLKIQLPGQLVSALFAAKRNEAVTASNDTVSYIAQINTIKSARSDADKKAAKALEKQLRENLKSDMSTQYANALREKLGVNIDNQAIQSAF